MFTINPQGKPAMDMINQMRSQHAVNYNNSYIDAAHLPDGLVEVALARVLVTVAPLARILLPACAME